MADDGDSTSAGTAPNKAASQLNKMREANIKYKSLLKMAKERIQAQEEELETLKAESKKIKDQLQQDSLVTTSTPNTSRRPSFDNTLTDPTTDEQHVVKVHQRIKTGDEETIHALMEMEVYPNPDEPPKRFQIWRKFETESELTDFCRRSTGEPLLLPAYSLTPAQSHDIQATAKAQVSQITEEFRRFRVKAEILKKQADAQIRDLHSINVVSATRRIEGEDLEKTLEQARTDHAQVEQLKAELAEQEAHWKEAYQIVMQENAALKSSGSEALLAAQWRLRYETLLKEKEELAEKLSIHIEKADVLADQRRKVDAGKYEMKYRDLKESFRLYRKKAKEIFEAQQRGDVGLVTIADCGSRDAKLQYIKNLMVNYLSSDQVVRDHMEGAIGTVLKFTPEEIAKIEKKKQEQQDAWF